jgi:dTDP-4-dehydrorhamnose reductase
MRQLNVLLLGAQGQLGHTLHCSLPTLGHVMAWGREQIDLSQPEQLARRLEDLSGLDVIVNAAAYTAVDRAEQESAQAFAVNAFSVQVLADYAHKHGCLLLHYSTDYVFSGDQTTPYDEEDRCGPVNVYGRSKRAGEEIILASGCDAFIFRTSWVYSAHGQNFIRSIWRLAQEREILNVVNDQYGCPTSVELLKTVSLAAITQYFDQGLAGGLYHVSAKGCVSWYDLARYVLEQGKDRGQYFKLDLKNLHPIHSQDYPTLARRPQYACLHTDKISNALHIQLPQWHQHVDEVLNEWLAPVT